MDGAGDDRSRDIEIIEARTHNLRGVTCRIPRGRITAVTGPSGSGKSSLALDTLFAEGFRRYGMALSTYARQFLDRLARPPVTAIRNLPPAIAIAPRNTVGNARSTVGTATEILDHLRLLYARIGRSHCELCHRDARAYEPGRVLAEMRELPAGTRLVLSAPLWMHPDGAPSIASLARDGWQRFVVDGRDVDLRRDGEGAAAGGEHLEVVVDRLVWKEGAEPRLVEAVQTAYGLAGGHVLIRGLPEGERLFGRIPRCPGCGVAFEIPRPNHFSFNSPLGACPTCQGFGREAALDPEKVIPDPRKSLAEGAVAAWNGAASRECYADCAEAFAEAGYSVDTPWEKLPEKARRLVWEGDRSFYGIRGFFEYLEGKRYKVQARIMIARYRSYHPCSACEGRRLRPESLRVRVDGLNLPELLSRSVAECRQRFDALDLDPHEAATVRRILPELRSRLRYLDRVGLGYLTLDRPMRTLSGGEAQRINLAAALGTDLNDTLFVLDEPSVGLHPRDVDRLIPILEDFREKGNTVVLVEHDATLIRAADHVLDLGPGAGREGGRLIHAGTPAALARRSGSVTGRWLSGKAREEAGTVRRRPETGRIRIRKARAHNLKDLSCTIPLGRLVALTGVSGSGKSSLAHDVLYLGYRRWRGESTKDAPGPCDGIEGLEALEDMVLVDQSPPARSSRSNPATYMKIFDPLRKLLADAAAARGMTVKPGFFSMNVPGGRCEHCEGAGLRTVEMHFLPDVEVPCDRCRGRRFGERALAVRVRGRNVHELLSMSVDELAALFEDVTPLRRKLETLREVGLGYLSLGQSMSTLSGGEAQRLKLARQLGSGKVEGHLFLFDEPTTGLHMAEVDLLLKAFERLLDGGASLLVITHDMALVSRADHVIDLGPEGGDGGGRLVFHGRPATLAKKDGWTARALSARGPRHIIDRKARRRLAEKDRRRRP